MIIIPIEPLDDGHGALIVEAFGRFLIDGGGEPDGRGDGTGYGYGDGYGRGDGYGDPLPDEWRVE